MKRSFGYAALLAVLATGLLAGCSSQEPAPTGPPKGGEVMNDSGSSINPAGGATQSVAPLTVKKGKNK